MVNPDEQITSIPITAENLKRHPRIRIIETGLGVGKTTVNIRWDGTSANQLMECNLDDLQGKVEII